MVKSVNSAAEIFIRGSKSFNSSKRWSKVAKATRLIKPVSQFAANQAMFEARIAESYFKLSAACYIAEQKMKESN